MAINFPGPWGLRIFYVVSGRDHKTEFSLQIAPEPDPGDPFSAVTVIRKDSSTDPLDVVTDEWIALLRPKFSSATGTILRAELWKYVFESFDAVFYGTYDISLAGTNTVAVSPASQGIYTFRTQEGGVFKLDILDTSDIPSPPQVYTALAGVDQDIVDYLLSSENPFIARDTSYPLAFLRFLPGQNERLWKSINRP